MNYFNNLWHRILKFLKLRIDERDIIHKKAVLNPNTFLDNRIVFYFETKYCPVANKYLADNYNRINNELSKKGMQLIYIPFIKSDPTNASKQILDRYLKYKFPELLNDVAISTDQVVDSLFEINDLSFYYKILGETLGIPEDCSPCLIHSVEYETDDSPGRNWTYSIFSLSTTNNWKLHLQVNYYLEKVRIASSGIFYSLKNRKNEPYDADELFYTDGHQVGDEIKQAITLIKNISNEKVLLASLIYLINALKDAHPDICKRLNENIFDITKQVTNKLSKVVVDAKYRIWLPEYQNTEIELTPLPKTFYLFMLKHPEGIMFKELPRYRDELIDIYSKVGNRYDMDQIRKSIFDLTDIKSNSVNEKCSRIKEAFVKKIDDSIAENYYITGDRNELKFIKIERSLIIFNERI